MPFQNSIVGAGNTLVREMMRSPDFVSDVSGWTINRDGSAEFNNVSIRGSVVVGGSIIMTDAGDGLFIYDGDPALGNLLLSIAPIAGTDGFGNDYPAGIKVVPNAGSIDGSVMAPGSILGDALADAAVTAANLAQGSVTQDALAAAAVGATELAAGAVYPDAIQAGAVTSNAIAAGAIVAGAIAAGAIDSMSIHAGTLTLDATSGNLLVYDGPATAGNLFISLSPTGGVDNFGNAFPAGIRIFNNGDITGADVKVNTSSGSIWGYRQ